MSEMNQCQRCSECEGQKHHWIVEPSEDFAMADEAFITCKHCPLKVQISDERQTFIEASDGSHTFLFLCDGCGEEGILSLEVERISDRIHCPNNCGAQYIMWTNPVTNQPDLMCVITPVFAEV